jgi:hypothetical protein
VQALDPLARREPEGDCTLAQARARNLVLELEREEQLVAVEDLLLDQELSEHGDRESQWPDRGRTKSAVLRE